MKKFLILICAVLILFAGCSNEEPVSVTAKKISTTGEILTIIHDGKISLGDEQFIRSPITGTVTEKFFKDGDEVTAGQMLFKIGKQETETEILQTKAKLVESMTTLTKELAQNNHDEKLQNEIIALQERINFLEEESATGIIYSPTSGQLGVENAQLGGKVLADETIVATIGKTDPVVVRFEISEVEKKFLMASEPKVSLKFVDGMSYDGIGTLNFIDDTIAEAVFENPDGILLLGNEVELALDGVKINDTVLVPEGVIQQREGGDYVFVEEDKKAVLKKISIGGKIGNNLIINDGLKAGNSIILESSKNLHEGTPLKNN